MKFKVITEAAERKYEFPLRHVILPRLTKAEFGTPEHEQWVQDNWWMANYSVKIADKPKAVELSLKLHHAFEESEHHPDIPSLLEEIIKLRVDQDNMTPLERWQKCAYQMVQYSGGPDVIRAIRVRLNGYKGKILEAMCGHTTYFSEAPRRKVTALDYCDISLERCPYPHRRRIQCDLNQIRRRKRMHFFRNGEFNVVSICFGIKYPKYIGPLLREFNRILRKGGRLSFVENPNHEYKDLRKRKLDHKRITNLLLKNGFAKVSITEIFVRSRERKDILKTAHQHVCGRSSFFQIKLSENQSVSRQRSQRPEPSSAQVHHSISCSLF